MWKRKCTISKQFVRAELGLMDGSVRILFYFSLRKAQLTDVARLWWSNLPHGGDTVAKGGPQELAPTSRKTAGPFPSKRPAQWNGCPH